MLRNPAQHEAKLVVQLQGLLAGLGCLVCFLFVGRAQATSFASGALVAVIPLLIIYRWLFRCFGARQAKAMFRALCLGEVLKLSLAIVGLSAVFLLLPHAQWALIGFIVMQGGIWLFALIQKVGMK